MPPSFTIIGDNTMRPDQMQERIDALEDENNALKREMLNHKGLNKSIEERIIGILEELGFVRR
jgi:hypothetical protein